MKIVLNPYETTNNKYIDLIKKAISNLNIEIYSLEDAIENEELFNEIDFFVLNWYESLYVHSFHSQLKKYILKMRVLKKLKKNNKKLIFVMHNKKPHNSKKTIFVRRLMTYLINESYKIIIHSNETKKVISEIVDYDNVEKKIVYVPHPNYIGAYKDAEENKEKNDKCLNLLFIGRIQQYKNVDLLVEVFNELKLENVKLTLAGKVNTKEYEEYINNLIGNNKNIIKEFRFIEDDEMQSFILNSDMLVLPYDIESSLNSGTIILAFSNKRTILSPLIGTLKDFEEDDNFFSYTYTDREGHKNKLKEKLIEVHEIYMKNNKDILNMGEKCYLMVKDKNSLQKVTESYKKVFFDESI